MDCILVMDAGSSSIKFGLFDQQDLTTSVVSGAITNIDQAVARFSTSIGGGPASVREISSENRAVDTLIEMILSYIDQSTNDAHITTVGHRIVHGGPRHISPEIVSDGLVADLNAIAPLSPKHLPLQISILKAVADKFTDTQQVACFDTAFHDNMPATAKILPIPRRYYDKGVRKYGFHGLSLESIVDQLKAQNSLPERMVIAHLGSGVSLTALRQGVSIDTTMSLSPNSGLPMSSRSGDIDPGILTYLSTSDNLDPSQISELLAAKSGLLGISDYSSDMEQLLANEASHQPSQQAVEVFCYSVRKQIGAYAAALGGLDALVFSGGMGEVAAGIRSRICDPLKFLGLVLDTNLNTTHQPTISSAESKVTIKIVASDEIRAIARHCQESSTNQSLERQ